MSNVKRTTSSISGAIERSSLGTRKAKANRRTVSQSTASKIVAASSAWTSNRKSVGGKRG
ncbi:hypothetical protein [uncultured Jatrophihabitans sp.]|uniref:hypothetical protein n=1 Tax=uncultured Jatrophihabitans sp. TaxID=1610747 RepID=UPI0035C9DC12